MTSSPVDARIDVEDRDGGIRVLTLRNPARRNALNQTLLLAIADALDPAKTGHVRAILVRGSDGAFSSGYDLQALPLPSGEGQGEGPGSSTASASSSEPKTDPGNVVGATLPDDHVGELLACVAEHPAPSVALVDGPAFGAGCELAVTCDFRVGGPGAVFCMPPAKLGIVYAHEGIAKVARIVGWQRAKRMFLTGMRVGSETAVEWGLVDERAADPAKAEEAALALCRELASNAPLAVHGMRRTISTLSRSELDEDAENDLRALRHAAYASEDLREGRAAFLEKRAARFSGK